MDAENPLSLLTAWATAVAAVATVASAVVIATQTWWTRRSVRATELALSQSRDVLLDSQRGRIDAEMPRLLTMVPRQELWVTIPQVHLGHGQDYEPIRVEEGHTFTLPRDADTLLDVTIDVVVTNDGPRRALLWADFLMSPDSRQEFVVPVGGRQAIPVRRQQTVSQWVDCARAYLSQEDPRFVAADTTDVPILELIHRFPGDVGAIERHRVMQGGSILWPVPGNDSAWSVRFVPAGSYGAVATVPLPFTREYWSSFNDNRPLE